MSMSSLFPASLLGVIIGKGAKCPCCQLPGSVWIISYELGEFFTTFLRPLLCDSNTVDEYSSCKYMDVVGQISLYSNDLTCAGGFDWGQQFQVTENSRIERRSLFSLRLLCRYGITFGFSGKPFHLPVGRQILVDYVMLICNRNITTVLEILKNLADHFARGSDHACNFPVGKFGY